MEAMTQTFACNNNWLDANGGSHGGTVQSVPTTLSPLTTGGYAGGISSSYYWPYYQVVSSPARPIKLAMSEIERLRKAAKADPKLKAILAKFTDQIEITVDFE